MISCTCVTRLRHASVTALLADSSASCVLLTRLALTRLAATSCAVAAATSLLATMSCSGELRPEMTPSAVSMRMLVLWATALAAEMSPSVQRLCFL
jgi:hypothetical protein